MRIPLRRYLSLLVRYLRPQWFSVVLMTLFLLANIGLQLLSPQILRYFIDTALAGGASLALVLAGLLFIVVTLLNQGVTIATSYFSESVAWTATNQLRSDLVAHCLALDMSFHKARTPGELIERIDGDVDALSNFFSQFVINLLGSGLLLVAVLFLLFTIHWLIGVVMTAFSVVTMLILMRLRRRATPIWKELRQKSAEFFGFLGERLTGTEDIRANGATGYIMRRFYEIVRGWLPINRRANMASFMMGSTSLFLFVGGTALVISLGTYLWSLGLATVGAVYLLFAYMDRLSAPINEIQAQLQDLQQAEACIQRIEELLSLEPALQDGPGVSLPEGALAVAFEGVAFGYVEDEPVIRDLSFQLPAGKVLGLLGRTGSGKTTLARLLFRMYDAQQGTVCVGGVPVQQARLRELRRRIGMVTQEVQLFQASVRNNLTLFNQKIDDQRILEVLEDLGLGRWYQGLAEGLDTQLEAEGAGLSAGEAQLLAFTRVFLNDPGLVILDEASSRLDPATERLIERAIDKLFVGRTVIVIAHRLSTIQRADEILILQDGCAVEQGARAELASNADSQLAQLLLTGLEEVLV